MKSFALFAAICAVALSAGGTKTANAATLDFDFTIMGMSGGQLTGDNATGEIDGLSDNNIGPASAVILDSFPASLGSVCSMPCDTTIPPWQFALDSHTLLPAKNFAVSGGQIVASGFFPDFKSVNMNNQSILEFAPASNMVIGFLTGPGGDMIGGPATFSTVSSATPLPAALPLFATGLGGLGLLGWRRKRKARAGVA